jgi:hypothetical protein
MTGPGGQVEVSPNDLYAMTGGWRAVDFTSGKPPPVPNGDDWSAVNDWHSAVDGTNQAHENRHRHRAHQVEQDVEDYRNVDEQNAQAVQNVGEGVDLQGFGSVMGAFMQPAGQAFQALSGLEQGTGTVFGQGMSASLNTVTSTVTNLAKNVGVGSVANAGFGPAVGGATGVVGGGGMPGVGGVEEDRQLGRPVSGQTAAPPGRPEGRGHAQEQDHDNLIVQPAGMGMPRPLGPGQGSSASEGSPVARVQKTDKQDEEDKPLPRVAVGPKGDRDVRADT